ncbi:class I SAM-dependent methyltransferase [Phenylobacterium sp.]|jgi:predicted SAM-dependent methyltransferase|uniref:class I SAM-dependent methyltransferase n=1 Tax=Phenylobacterium sp. TaxID=1871053 RepID=UPI002F952432
MPLFLHVGSGTLRKADTTRGFATPDWDEVRLDIDPDVEPDIIGSMLDMSAVPDGFADAIYSAHNVEHVFFHEVPALLAEFRRVLKPDGFVVINCPDLQAVAERVAKGELHEPLYTSPSGPISAHDVLFGYGRSLVQGKTYMAHKCGFTQTLLKQVLNQAGFASVGVMRRAYAFDLWALAARAPMAEPQLRDLAAQHFPY